VTELLIAFHWIDVAGDQFLAQRPAAETGTLQQRGGRVTADREPVIKQFLRQLQRLQVGPAYPLIGGAAGAAGIEHLVESRRQRWFAFGDRRPAAAGPSHPPGVAARALRMIGVALAHLLQLAHAGVDRSSAHAQHARDVGDAPVADFQGFDCRIATTMILRQRSAIQPHRLLMRWFITRKLVHRVASLKLMLDSDARSSEADFQVDSDILYKLLETK